MVVCVECLPADKPWDVVSATRRSSGVAPRACVRVYARVLVPPNLYIYTYIHTPPPNSFQACSGATTDWSAVALSMTSTASPLQLNATPAATARRAHWLAARLSYIKGTGKGSIIR